jgi:enoyl-CoA hydratase
MNELNPARPIVCEIVGSIAIVKFNRPDERNSLSTVTLNSLDTLLSNLISDHTLRTIIFTGTGNAFLAGADIRELATLDPQTARDFSRQGQGLLQKLVEAPQMTIAAVNGYCMGGGLDLALACDIRVASSSAVFAHPGARLGIITGWGGTQRLPRIIGKARALEFFITSQSLTSKEALVIGLVSRVGDPVIDCALEFSRKKTRMAE